MNTYGAKAIRVVVSLFPLVFALPQEFFNGSWTMCIFKNLTGSDCYGCGITRAIYLAIHLRFHDAISMNPLVLIVIPLLSYLYIKNLLELNSVRFNKNLKV